MARPSSGWRKSATNNTAAERYRGRSVSHLAKSCGAEFCNSDRHAANSPQPIPRPRPLASCHIGRVRKATPVDRQAAATDALGKPGPQALQLGDALVDALCPLARQPRPIPTRRHAIGWQLGELGADLLKRQPNPLRKDDEGDPAQHGSRIASVPRAGPLGRDQPALLVETQGR